MDRARAAARPTEARTGPPAASRRGYVAVWSLTVALTVTGAVLTAIAWSGLKPADAAPAAGLSVAAIVYATLGALIVRKVGNRIGWLLLGEGLGLSLLSLTSMYAVAGAVTHPGFLPAAKIVGTLSEWVFVPIVIGLAYMLLVFPTGALPSRRWRPVAVVAVAITGLALIGFTVTPREVTLPAPGGVSLTFPNPFAIRSLGHGILTTLLVGFVSALVFLFGIPVAITIAILRYGLYEIDVIINRTVVYGLLAAAVTAVYVTIVAGIGTLAGYGGGPVLSVAAAVAIALLFQPLRRQ